MPWLDTSPFREISDPVTKKMFARLPRKLDRVQVVMPVSERTLKRTAELMKSRPTLPLRFYSGSSGKSDLGFLKHFPNHLSVMIDLVFLTSFGGLELLTEKLRLLAIGGTIKKTHSLQSLARFSDLKQLYLETHCRDIDVIGGLNRLEGLSLRSITLPNLDILLKLPKIQSFALRLGGTRKVDALASLERLKSLEIWRVNGLKDVSVIENTVLLKRLFLQHLPNVKSIPPLDNHKSLQSLTLIGMKSVRDLGFLRDACALKTLEISDAPSIPLNQLKVIRELPALRSLVLHMGSLSRSRAAADLLNMPGRYGPITIDRNGKRTDRLAALREQMRSA